MLSISLKDIDTFTSVLAHLAVFGGAIVAFFVAIRKFRLLERPPRYKSELVTCRHHQLTDKVIFEAEYAVYNLGDRPIDINSVTISLCPTILKSGSPLDVADDPRTLIWRPGKAPLLTRLALGKA